MSLPVLHGIGRLTSEPELKFTQNGMSFAKVSLAFNSRKKDDSGNWVDGDVFFITGTLWKEAAENAAETLSKGMEVVVSGKLRTESWESDGVQKSKTALAIDVIAPTLRFATAVVTKTDRNGGQSSRSVPAQQYADPSEPPF